MQAKQFFSAVGHAVLLWPKRNLICLDQWVNVFFFFGHEDETISARCWRLRDRWGWRVARRIIDGITRRIDPDHCAESYKSEQDGAQLPPEYRPGKK